MMLSLTELLSENAAREKKQLEKFNPITGEGSIGVRIKLAVADFLIRTQYIPIAMENELLVKQLLKYGSFQKLITFGLKREYTEELKTDLVEMFIRIRFKHDFAFWAAFLAKIKAKGGGDDVLFRLNRPQRKLIEAYEAERVAGVPIRFVLLKARQWGGSTATQIYMAWLQLVHKNGLNSLIIAHQGTGSDEINNMFSRLIQSYPSKYLHAIGEPFNEDEAKFVGVGKSGAIHKVPQRNCNIKIGTAERPDSCRGGDYNLVHLSEVGLWKTTLGKKPEDIVRSACSGVLYADMTMIVYESTANGTGNFFQIEYDAAKRGTSQFKPLFIAWFDIELYSLPFSDDDDKRTFATWLWENKANENAMSDREECGKYLWWLFSIGATLENINWYVKERAKYHDHGSMASEYPSDDVEAFVNSGARVFDKYHVDKFRHQCKQPRWVGDIYADYDDGERALENIRFTEDKQGMLWVWAKPDIDKGEKIENRYLAVVDIGGRRRGADYSVIVVYDRLFMMDGEKPSVVAQWYGHIDMDLLAWKAAQIATYYDDALLVIESNTLETKDRDRRVDGDQSSFILSQIGSVYGNLYARKQSEEDIINKVPRKYGFHTNTSTKPAIISTLVKCVREQSYIERDARCLDEFITYERKQSGAYGAILGCHDDLLMTRAIGLHICFFEMPLPRIIKRGAYHHTFKRQISAATI